MTVCIELTDVFANDIIPKCCSHLFTVRCHGIVVVRPSDVTFVSRVKTAIEFIVNLNHPRSASFYTAAAKLRSEIDVSCR